MFAKGIQAGFFSGDYLKLKDDLDVLKPTVMIAVPRILIKFYDGIMGKLNELQGFKRNLIDKAVASKVETYSRTG